MVPLPAVAVLLTATLSTGGPLYLPRVPVASMITPALALHTSPAAWHSPPWKSLVVPPARTWMVAVPPQVTRTTPGSVPVNPPLHAWFAAPPSAPVAPVAAPDCAATPAAAVPVAGAARPPPWLQPASASIIRASTVLLDRFMAPNVGRAPGSATRVTGTRPTAHRPIADQRVGDGRRSVWPGRAGRLPSGRRPAPSTRTPSRGPGYLALPARSTSAVAARKNLLRPRSPIVLMLNASASSLASPSLTPDSAATGASTSSARVLSSYALSKSLARSAITAIGPPSVDESARRSRRAAPGHPRIPTAVTPAGGPAQLPQSPTSPRSPRRQRPLDPTGEVATRS